ncbi:MAG: cysteine desulfurase family protein, partial [bacterium]
MENRIYLDHLSTTPCDPRVAEVMWPYMTTHYGNPSAVTHAAGREAAVAVDRSRASIAGHLNVSKEEIIFTSGATESINMAIKSVFSPTSATQPHLITCGTEHSAVLEVCRDLEKMGCAVTVLPVDHQGSIDHELLKASIQQNTAMVAIMHANNETGLIHDIQRIGEICAAAGVLFFCDATQSVGKLHLDLQQVHIDLMAFSGHKFYGPKGIGGLYINKKCKTFKPVPLLHGGGQEFGMRGGTLNVPGIVGISYALDLALEEMDQYHRRMATILTAFEHKLMELGDILINGYGKQRLPGVSSVSFKCIEGQALLSKLNEALCVSSGAACSSVTGKPSHVLTAMG